MRNDVRQYEANYKVITKTKHQAPTIATPSIIPNVPLQLRKLDPTKSMMLTKRRTTVYNIESDSSLSEEDGAIKDNENTTDEQPLPRQSKSMHR